MKGNWQVGRRMGRAGERRRGRQRGGGERGEGNRKERKRARNRGGRRDVYLSIEKLGIFKRDCHLTGEHQKEVHAVLVEKALVQVVLQVERAFQFIFYHNWHAQNRFY
jgi:hypothetical protein